MHQFNGLISRPSSEAFEVQMSHRIESLLQCSVQPLTARLRLVGSSWDVLQRHRIKPYVASVVDLISSGAPFPFSQQLLPP